MHQAPSRIEMDPQTRQRAYYGRTAGSYDAAHVAAGDEHYVALGFVASLMAQAGATSVLDVGCGTGRALRFLRDAVDLSHAAGVEPVPELRAVATGHGLEARDGVAEQLPYPDDAFDVVVATGVMHHLPEPARAVAEMQRVARRAIFISDDNRFGHGPAVARRAKLLLHAARLWPAFETLRTRGRGFMESDGDGVFWSYSIFDSLPALAAWGDRAFVIPTAPTTTRSTDPRLAASHGLLVALRG